MIVSPDIYSGGAQPTFNMNCGLQYDTRHSIFPGLSIESHWLPHHSTLTTVKQEPRDESDYNSHYVAKNSPPGNTGFQSPLTPPGLNQGGGGNHGYTYPTPPQAADYVSPDYTPPPATPQTAGSPPAQDHPRPPSAPVERDALKSVATSPRLTPPGSLPSPNNEQHQEKPSDQHQDNSQSSNSENEFYENGDSLRRLQLALQRTGMMPEEKLQCPVCDFTCSVRSQFNEHLVSHETKCPACDFSAETSEKLKEHVRANHENLPDMDHMWAEDEPGLTTPKVNSQGKVKTFRCKQCDFAAVTKLEFWEHSRTHIKQERLLTCPKCPFVTEYKHHLEYHLRNHFGSKPFKCDRCSYSCVNKSMLNSHLKSHSNVYQFRCADCTYATKYCHSLKLHLRKYGHSPAMVLNPDGSPNPLPIVDVYGTRRGPKQKPKQHIVDKPAPTQRVSVPLFNPYTLLPTQMPYYNILNGFTPFPFGPDVKMEETNNNVEKEEILREECDERTPLDLTCPEQPESDNASNASETPISKNRRKGKAFKLERIALRLQQPSDDESGANKGRPESPPTSGMASPEIMKCDADSETTKPERSDKRDEYDCSYCDISFKDIVMYTMHMGYHGYQDPFTCNMCGQQTTDKVSFFLHIARTSHS